MLRQIAGDPEQPLRALSATNVIDCFWGKFRGPGKLFIDSIDLAGSQAGCDLPSFSNASKKHSLMDTGLFKPCQQGCLCLITKIEPAFCSLGVGFATPQSKSKCL